MAEEVKTSTVSGVGKRAERRDEYSDAPVGRKWQAFKLTFSGGLMKVIISSALCLVFCAPSIAWIIACSMMFLAGIGTSLPYGIHDGMGYLSPTALPEGLNSAYILGNIQYFETSMMEFSVLIPCLAVAAIGIGGLVYVARMAMNKEPIKVRHFFIGVKNTWSTAIFGGALVGAAILLVMFCFYSFDAAALGGPVNMGGKVVTMIFSIMLLVLVSIYSFYLLTLPATYKMPYFDVFKDALKLTFVRLPMNLFGAFFVGIIVGAAFLLILLLGNSTFGMLFWALLFFVGFYAITAVFTVFNASVFDTSINEELNVRETRAATEEAYAAIRAQKAAGKVKTKKAQDTKFVNPKKRKKTAAEEKAEADAKAAEAKAKQAQIAPKSAKAKGYTAEELAQLAEDKEKIRSESEERKPDDNAVDMSLYEDDGE